MKRPEFLSSFLNLLGITDLPLSEGKLAVSEEQKAAIKKELSDEEYTVLMQKLNEYVESESVAQAEAQAKNEELSRQLKESLRTIEQLSEKPTAKAPAERVLVEMKGAEPRNVTREAIAKYFKGIEHPFYAKGGEKWWNALTHDSTPKQSRHRNEERAVKMEMNAYFDSVADRVKQLHINGKLEQLFDAADKGSLDEFSKSAAAGDISYTDINTQFGSYFYTRRQDELISYIRNLNSVFGIFPLHGGVQDGETIVSLFHGRSNTQAFQAGKIVSGSEATQGDIARVKDVMFSKLFKELWLMERTYIGYLNTSGSDPVKLSFIEYIMRQVMQLIVNEDNERCITGVRVEPTPSSAAYFNYAADGVLTTLQRYIDEHRAYIDTDSELYTSSTIYDYFKAFGRKVLRLLGQNSLAGWGLYMNANDVPMFLDAYGTKFGQYTDYTGDRVELKHMLGLTLIAVPNMGDRQDAFITPLNNFEIVTWAAGEEFRFYQDLELETIYIKSRFKRGSAAYRPGRTYASQAALVAARAKDCVIFVNKPVTRSLADATTVNGAVNRYFLTIANSGATVITDVLSAAQGVLYRIECGSLTNATTIAKANKFSELTGAWTPQAVGDFIELIWDPTTDKFYDYARRVNGVYAKNTALVAPAYVETI
jgi:hypothetical protein